MKKIITFLFAITAFLSAQNTFTDIGEVLAGVTTSSVAWADYDNDGDQDFVLTGHTGTGRISRVYRNDNGVFTDIKTGLTGVSSGSVAWADYDKDGDLDFIMTGDTGSGYISKICMNNGDQTFTMLNKGIPGVAWSSVDWADLEKDGDPDILLTGGTGTSRITKIYRNTNGSFAEYGTGLPGVSSGCAVWEDFDKDGYMDVLLTGFNDSVGKISAVYRNNGSGTFVNINAGLDAVYYSSADWGDFDRDGDIDILIAGYNDTNWTTKIYSNNGSGAFTYFSAALTGIADGSVEWGDYDNNGYLDILISGWDGAARVSKIYRYADSNFSQLTTGLTAVKDSSARWGDYDSDGDLDVLLTGDSGSGYISKIYRTDLDQFSDIYSGFTGVYFSSVSWGDYDNDCDLDVLLTGDSGSGYISKIYQTDLARFSDIYSGITGVSFSSVAWGDYDNDGDLDVLLTGYAGTERISRIYTNNIGSFTTFISLEGVYNSSVAWGDYDNDGDLDVLLTGYSESGVISRIYRNDDGIFTDISAALPGVQNGSVAWGDYDNDGDLDFLLTGNTGSSYITRFYTNDIGSFSNHISFEGVSFSSVAWGDYDNDGDLDVLLTGYTGTELISKIYTNNTGSFTNGISLEGVSNSSVAWGDYDNDGDLDVLLTGDSDSGFISRIYRNNNETANTKPSKPSKLITSIDGDILRMSFNKASDTQTSQNGLSYNLDVNVNGLNAKTSMSNLINGYRRSVSIGNVSQNSFYEWDMKNIVSGLPQCQKILSWKVQAVDHCFEGSEFASSPEFDFSGRDLLVYSKSEMYGDDYLKWEYAFAEYLDHYELQIDDDYQFKSPIEETIDLEKSDIEAKSGGSKVLYYTKTLNSLTDFDSLKNNITYYWRVKPVYSGRFNETSLFNSAPLSFVFNPGNIPPNAPISGFNPSNDSITDDTPMISWNVATDPDGHAEDLYYICQIDTINTFSTIQYADTTSAGISSVQVSSSLFEGYRYYYRVKTVDTDALQSGWSVIQNFLVVMPPNNLKITDDGTNVNLTWDAFPINSKGIVYTVYSSADPYAVFPTGWQLSADQLTTNSWSEPHSAVKKFYKITVGSSGK